VAIYIRYLNIPVIANEVWQSTSVIYTLLSLRTKCGNLHLLFKHSRLSRFLPKPRNDMLLGHVDSNWMPTQWPAWQRQKNPPKLFD